MTSPENTQPGVPALLEAMGGSRGRDRMIAGRRLWMLSETRPQLLAPHAAEIEAFVEGPNKVLCWTAIRVLGNMAGELEFAVARGILGRLLMLVPGPTLITSANALEASSAIAMAHPGLLEEALAGMLRAEKGRYQTPECRRVITGKLLRVLEQMGPAVLGRPEVVCLLQRQVRCPRPAVARKAVTLLARLVRRSGVLA